MHLYMYNLPATTDLSDLATSKLNSKLQINNSINNILNINDKSNKLYNIFESNIIYFNNLSINTKNLIKDFVDKIILLIRPIIRLKLIGHLNNESYLSNIDTTNTRNLYLRFNENLINYLNNLVVDVTLESLEINLNNNIINSEHISLYNILFIIYNII